jgi:hypothetical protein
MSATRLESEQLGFSAFFRFMADHPGLCRIIREAELVSPVKLHLHYGRIVEGYVPRLRAAMDAGEIPPADPEVLAWALTGLGELIGMRWVLWDEDRAMPAEVMDQTAGLIARILGVSS